MNFNKVQNPVGEKKAQFLFRKAFDSRVLFWHILTSIPCLIIAISPSFSDFIQQAPDSNIATVAVQTCNFRAERQWALQREPLAPSTLRPLVGHPRRQETWPPRRWTVLIQQHMPSGESDGYPRRYYGRWNEAHPFPAAWRMTCGNWGLWWGWLLPYLLHSSHWLTKQNECLNPPILLRVSISSFQSLWLWLFLLTAQQTIP